MINDNNKWIQPSGTHQGYFFVSRLYFFLRQFLSHNIRHVCACRAEKHHHTASKNLTPVQDAWNCECACMCVHVWASTDMNTTSSCAVKSDGSSCKLKCHAVDLELHWYLLHTGIKLEITADMLIIIQLQTGGLAWHYEIYEIYSC